ncbi:MAG TPA: hypothetical protein VF644_01315 [Pyrinomonadaceae bacterium]|jgi:hypothetical protein
MSEKSDKKRWSYQSLPPEIRRATHKAVKNELIRRWRTEKHIEAALPFDDEDEFDLRYAEHYLYLLQRRSHLFRLHAQLTGRMARSYGTDVEISYRRFHIKWAASKIAKETGISYEKVVEELLFEMSDYLTEF